MPETTPEGLGLRTLEDISDLILHSHDLQETLDNIVNLVAKRTRSDVCSIYLLETDGETLRLKASKGLSRSSIGKIAMKTSEGLTGLVVEQRQVVAIKNAPDHPRYKYFKETREEKFHSFLGVPLYEHKAPTGVLVIQTREPREFTAGEVSAVTTIGYQIASIVTNAKLLDSIRVKEEERAFFQQELERMKSAGVVKGDRPTAKGKRLRQQLILPGTPASPGVCWGKVTILSQRGNRANDRLEQVLSRPEEHKRFQMALEKARIQTIYLEKRVAQSLSPEDAAIFHTHLMILEDRGFVSKVSELVDRDYGAVRAVQEVVGNYVDAFSRMEDPYLRERSADMRDIGRRIVDCLDGYDLQHGRFRGKRIIVAEDILPSDMATLDHDKVLGIVTEKGDVTSHAAIMAKSLGIPAVLAARGIMQSVGMQDDVIIDGNSGQIYINPDTKIKQEYERLQRDYNLRRQELEGIRDLPAETTDGCRVILRANIGLLSDIRVALSNGAEGVGLYRTEFPYMARKAFPNRFEQTALYQKILEGFPGQTVTFRTLDIGGDKGLPYFEHPQEDNPFMGWRSIRFSLERQDIFREQIAAILMASPHGKARLMFPMISSVDEIKLIRQIMTEVEGELTREGRPFDPHVPLGIMVELPAAVQTAGILIREVDFFSIGTNDLIQYTLAADRNNPRVKKYFDPYHPAVLHSIRHVAEVAHGAGKGVSLCGEMAADPLNAGLLLGLGIEDLSLSAPYIPPVKQALRGMSRTDARALAQKVLEMESGVAIRLYLESVQRELATG